MNELFDEVREMARGSEHAFDLEDETLREAFDVLARNRSRLCGLKNAKTDPKADFESLVRPLLDAENKSKRGKKPWRVVIDMPSKDGVFIADPTVQVCSGPPSYDRIVIRFGRDGSHPTIDNSCVESLPDLGKIRSQFSPDGKSLSLQDVKEFYDGAGVQRIAILGGARVFPHPEPIDPNDLSKGFKEPRDETVWAQGYTTRVQEEVNKFFDYLEKDDIPFTTVNGGWAGTLEGSTGVPLISHLFGIVHDADSGGFFPPITVMPQAGAFDRVTTKADTYPRDGLVGDSQPHVSTYFEVPGVWGDDSKYLAGVSTSLLVFEPYGFWTNIEIANGVAQGKAVAIIADAKDWVEGGAYHGELRADARYIVREIRVPGGVGSYRIYRDASDAARWVNEYFRLHTLGQQL